MLRQAELQDVLERSDVFQVELAGTRSLEFLLREKGR